MGSSLYGSDIPQELYEENWMGAYLHGEKIGYSCRNVTKLSNGYIISEALKVRLKMMGVEKDIETIMDAETDYLFRLSSFVFRLRSDVPIKIKGRVEGKKLSATIDTGSISKEQTIRLEEAPYLSFSMIPTILRKGLKPRNKVSLPIIDPTTLSQEYMEITVASKYPIISMGRIQDAYKLKGVFKGIETFLWLTEKGEVLREQSPLGFTLIKESKENANQLNKPSVDLIAQIAIPFDIKLPDPIDFLKVRIYGIDLKGLELDGGGQKLKGDILEIKRATLLSGVRDQALSTPDKYLKDTIFIQSKDPAIISLAKDIVGNEKDRLKITKLIYEWVYKNINKVPTISLPMATEVLRTKEGDCNEHSTLFAAFSRAAGIPSRIAVGLTYKNGFFYYHAWPEVYLNEWIAVDPTLGQFPADASHIRLLTGDIDKQLQLSAVIGKLKLEGIDYR